jgi:hypothetical protein
MALKKTWLWHALACSGNGKPGSLRVMEGPKNLGLSPENLTQGPGFVSYGRCFFSSCMAEDEGWVRGIDPNTTWLVVWNMNFMTFYDFPIKKWLHVIIPTESISPSFFTTG